MDFSNVEAVINDALGRVFPAAQIEVRRRGAVVFSRTCGWLDPDTQQRPVRPDSLFDLASVTKLFVVTAFMTLVEERAVKLDQAVGSVLPVFSGVRPIQPYEDPLQPGAFVQVDEAGGNVDAGQVTFRNLLAHTSGLPAWRPLHKEGSPEAMRQMALTSHFSYPTGARVVYSDIGLILLGMAIERLTGQALDKAVQRRVMRRLDLPITSYRPIGQTHNLSHDNVAPTEWCAWRQRRVVGEVHDENAYALGGIAGHAGLFSTASELSRFGQSLLDGGRPILSERTLAEMTRLQAEYQATRRGLGFVLWSPDPEASGNPFSQRAFGHTGFTGTSLWVDPDRALVVACLTNDVYHGRERRGIGAFRVALHRALVEAADAEQAQTNGAAH